MLAFLWLRNFFSILGVRGGSAMLPGIPIECAKLCQAWPPPLSGSPRLASRNWTKFWAFKDEGRPRLEETHQNPYRLLPPGLPFKRRRARAVKNARDPMPQAPCGRQELSVELGGMSLAPFGTASPSAYSGSRGALGDHRGPRHPGWVPTFAGTCILVRPIADALEQGHNPQALLKAYSRLTDEMLEFASL